MVNGLVIQTSTTEIGKLQRKIKAKKAATTIWKGIGIKAQNTPTKKAIETERRFKCQRLGS